MRVLAVIMPAFSLSPEKFRQSLILAGSIIGAILSILFLISLVKRVVAFSVFLSTARLSRLNETCLVCWDGPVFFPTKPPTSGCNHHANVCHACLKKTIKSLVTSNGAGGKIIRCPSIKCNSVLMYYDVRQWVDDEVFRRYDYSLLSSALNSDPTFIRCLNHKCNTGMFYIGGDLCPLVKCYACGAEQCFRHQIPWHKGLTCEEYQIKSTTETENLTNRWLNEQTKACPGPGCKRRIQKIDGCDHMTCRKPAGCGFQLFVCNSCLVSIGLTPNGYSCWVCLAPWRSIIQHDNSYHYDNCRYYTGKPYGNPAPPPVLLPLHDPPKHLVPSYKP